MVSLGEEGSQVFAAQLSGRADLVSHCVRLVEGAAPDREREVQVGEVVVVDRPRSAAPARPERPDQRPIRTIVLTAEQKENACLRLFLPTRKRARGPTYHNFLLAVVEGLPAWPLLLGLP